jgi:protein-S-isoprenylcysteine O-methyltransferase Ste14
MPRYSFPKPYADFVARLRVPTGFLLIAAFAYLSTPDVRSMMIGIPVAALGLALRGWAAGHLAKNQRLATGGPYAYLRNPLYLGTLLVAAGLAIASRSALLALIFTAVFILVYLPVIELEEQHLRNLFPDYAEYAARVPLLWPRISSTTRPTTRSLPNLRSPNLGQSGTSGSPSSGKGRFCWRLYLRNQEYQAFAGFIAGVLLLIWKASR